MSNVVDLDAKRQTKRRERSLYSIDVAADICDMIIEGMHPRDICDGREGRPSHASTMFLWLSLHPAFEDLYRRAWEWRVEQMALEIIQIADDDSEDVITTKTGSGDDAEEKTTFNRSNLARHKMMIENRWRALAIQFPKKYGATTLGGAAIKNGSDAKVIEQSPADERKLMTTQALYEDAQNWDAPKQ